MPVRTWIISCHQQVEYGGRLLHTWYKSYVHVYTGEVCFIITCEILYRSTVYMIYLTVIILRWGISCYIKTIRCNFYTFAVFKPKHAEIWCLLFHYSYIKSQLVYFTLMIFHKYTISYHIVIYSSNDYMTPVTGEFSTQRPATRSFDVFFDLRLNKRLSKQWWGWRFGMPSGPLWRHCDVMSM